MGLFRRNKKSKIHSGSLPSSLPGHKWSKTTTRQEQGGTKTNIHDGSPIMSATDSGGNLVKRETTKGSGTLPKPAREDLEEYESKYVARKPAEKKETSSSCDNCGAKLKLTAKFCGRCGTQRS